MKLPEPVIVAASIVGIWMIYLGIPALICATLIHPTPPTTASAPPPARIQ